jgi:ERCC4-type nuclease
VAETMSPTVIIDKKEYDNTKERIAEKLKALGLDIDIRELFLTKYLIIRDDRNFNVERMDIMDYFSQLETKEIYQKFSQLSNVNSIMIVEFSELNKSFFDLNIYSKILESQMRALFKYGVPVFLVSDLLTPKIIHYIATSTTFEVVSKERKVPLSNIEEIALSMVMRIPNVGPKTAARLLASFKSLRNLANSDVKDLKLVEGISEEKAKIIYEIFNKKFV